MTRFICGGLVLSMALSLVPASAYGQYNVRAATYRQSLYQQAAYQQAAYQQALYQRAAYQQALYQQRAAYQQALYQQAAYQQAPYQSGGYQQVPYPPTGYQQASGSSPSVSAGIYYRSPFAPVSIRLGTDGISIQVSPEVNTPAGTVGVDFGVRLGQ